MKKYICLVVIGIGLAAIPTGTCRAQFTDVIKAIIKAIDVGVQKAQNVVIDLQNQQKALENILSETKLGEIGDWVEKHRAQYAAYFDELKTVKDAISGFNKVREIMDKQVRLVNEYKQAYNLFRQDKHFSPDELDYMLRVYTGIVDESLKNLDQLFLVVNAFKTEMTDGKRLEIIGTVGRNIDNNLNDLRQFNTENALLSLQRARSANEVIRLKALYGLQ